MLNRLLAYPLYTLLGTVNLIMEDWRMMIVNDPDSPPWWVWLLLAGILIGLVIWLG